MQYYNTIAKSYNELHKEEQKNKINIIKSLIKIKQPVLDIGAGTGISSEPFKAIALDPSIEMLKQYKGKKVQAIAESLPFKDNTFNTIISVTALHHSNIKKALKEIERVAKKDANIAITILKKSKIRLTKPFQKIEESKDFIYYKKI
jgi:ubiquinone/menaquinone biosynthesis C-methylase UbiE